MQNNKNGEKPNAIEESAFQELWKQLRPTTTIKTDQQHSSFFNETILSDNLRSFLQVIVRLIDLKKFEDAVRGSKENE